MFAFECNWGIFIRIGVCRAEEQRQCQQQRQQQLLPVAERVGHGGEAATTAALAISFAARRGCALALTCHPIIERPVFAVRRKVLHFQFQLLCGRRFAPLQRVIVQLSVGFHLICLTVVQRCNALLFGCAPQAGKLTGQPPRAGERSDNNNNNSQKKLMSLLWAKSSLASHKSISKCSAQNEINTQTQFHRLGRAFFYIILINCLL